MTKLSNWRTDLGLSGIRDRGQGVTGGGSGKRWVWLQKSNLKDPSGDIII